MIRSPELASLALAGLLLAVPVSPWSQVIPQRTYFVRNTSSATLQCHYRLDAGAWSRPLALKPGAEFTLPRVADRVAFFCHPPVKRVAYTLQAGQRYAILRDPDGSLALRQITVGG